MRKVAGSFLQAFAVLAGVVLVAFLMVRLAPGDPVALLGAHPGMGPDELAELRRLEGLDRALPRQFAAYLTRLVHGDLGVAVSTGQPVGAEIARRLPASLELALAGFVPALMLAVIIGLGTAWAPGGWIDRAGRIIAAVGSALPVFVTGLLLIQTFYIGAGLVPEPSGRLDPFLSMPRPVTGWLLADALLAGDGEVFRSALAQLFLPAMTMALFAVAPMARVFRASMLAAMAGPGERGALMLGLPRRKVLLRYALPEAVVPLVPVAVLTFGYMLGANVLVETVFAWPGVGRFALNAMMAQDFAAVQGVMLVLAAILVCLSLLSDLLLRWLDPRIAHG